MWPDEEILSCFRAVLELPMLRRAYAVNVVKVFWLAHVAAAVVIALQRPEPDSQEIFGSAPHVL